MKKTVLKLFAALSAVCILTGCSGEIDSAINENLPIMGVAEEVLPVEFCHDVDGISIETSYQPGSNYQLEDWNVTDSKTLMMSLKVVSQPIGAEVFVEHVHADVSLAAKYQDYNGILQDSMDDSYHGTNQPGFFVSEEYPYKECFSIEGHSQTLVQGWASMYGGSVDTVRVTESMLGSHGCIGNKIQVVYNLNIRLEGEEFFHTRTLVDEFYVASRYYLQQEAEKATNAEQ